MSVPGGDAFLIPEEAASGMQDGGCTSDAPADASGMTGEEWADMFPVPEGFTLREYPPLSEERIAELAQMFSPARDKTV
jgi:hypothetical protein